MLGDAEKQRFGKQSREAVAQTFTAACLFGYLP
jgi:hypothetical protein